jgi:hypothetical protein
LGRLTSALCVAALVVAMPSIASAQQEDPSLFERFGLDKLRLSALGASIGAVKPTQIVGTRAYALHADYGEIAPGWRVVFVATYWGSHYTDRTLSEFRDSLRRTIVDPTADYTLDVGKVTVSDIALAADLRRTPGRFAHWPIRPYVGGGLSAHVINAEGRAIAGTFVERALDNITAGVAGMTGADVVLFRHFSFGMQARYDLLSGSRYGSVRAVATYLLTPLPARGGA